MSLFSGARLGPYEIGAAIGAGGMGQVYKAVDSRLGRQVAIKALPPEFSADPERLTRFEQEARAERQRGRRPAAPGRRWHGVQTVRERALRPRADGHPAWRTDGHRRALA